MDQPDIRERGASGQSSDRRLFVQLLAFGGCQRVPSVVEALEVVGVRGVLYEDVSDPRGVGLVAAGEDPAALVFQVRNLVNGSPFDEFDIKHTLTMLGRTYAIGYEPDLDEVLIERPMRNLLHPDWPWAIWYPLRRKGQFSTLPADEQRAILAEHGKIGHAFGSADLAHDIRLACHGLDGNDNDFVVGLVGKELAALSKLVETMRRTQQTSKYIEHMGPFFIGRKIWQNK